MDYGLLQEYGISPLSQLGKAKNVWGIPVYGLREVWDWRELTVLIVRRREWEMMLLRALPAMVSFGRLVW